jgi:glycosyltransferase involved in cell wall biosynthesis
MDGVAKVGGMDRTKEYALEQGLTVGLLENPLTTVGPEMSGGNVSRLSLLAADRREELEAFRVRPDAQPWRWFVEPWRSATVVRRHLAPGFVCFAEDGLSGLCSLSLRRSGHARACHLHCSDFATRRFGSRWLSAAYLAIYRHNVRRSDGVLCVSQRMIHHFRTWDVRRPYVFFPNTPDCDATPLLPVAERRRGQLVLLGPSHTGMNHGMLVEGLKALVARYPEVRLAVVGSGGAERRIRERAEAAGIAGAVEIRGFLPRADALRAVAQSWLGVVLYTDEDPFNYYRDSIKIREYAACGLPTVCDATTGTGEEGERAGAARRVRTTAEFVEAVSRLLTDAGLYVRTAEAARRWAVANDKRRLLEDLWPTVMNPRAPRRN